MFRKVFIFNSIVFVISCLLVTSMSYAGTWKPYQFQKGERYEFKIVLDLEETEEVTEEGGEEITETSIGEESIGKESIYIIETKEVPQKEGFVELTFTTKSIIKEEDLSYEKVFGFGEITGIPLSMLIINPMYSYIFEQIDLEVGEKVKLLGIGSVKVISKEKIIGREGFVCQFFQQTEKNEEKLLAEWIIDPDLALPLRAKNFEDGKLRNLFELISYSRD